MRRVLALALLVPLLAACGGDDDEPYVDRMEAACDDRDKAFNDLVQPIPDDFSPEYVAAVVEGSVEVISTYLDAVRDIGSPGDDLADEHEEYVALLEQRLEDFQRAVGDDERSAEVFNQQAPEFAELESALGLATCGQPGNGLEQDEAD